MKKIIATPELARILKFRALINDFANFFKIIDCKKCKHRLRQKLEPKPKPSQAQINPKDFLNAINNTIKNKKEIFITPQNKHFSQIIKEINSLTLDIKEKAALLFYTLSRTKSFNAKTPKIAIICLVYFLFENNVKNAKNLTEKKELLFVLSLLIEKSKENEKEEMLELVKKFLIE